MPKLTIFRGLPGSGKSTRARELSAQTGAIVIEPDMLCMIDGKYRWNETRWKTAKETARAVLMHVAFSAYSDAIYADVLPHKYEVTALAHPLLSVGYDLEVIDCEISVDESVKRNVHNVPVTDITRMHNQWEAWE